MNIRPMVDKLTTDGILVFPQYFQDQLPELWAEFHEQVYKVEPDEHGQRIFDRAGPATRSIARDETILAIINSYFNQSMRPCKFRGKRLASGEYPQYDAFQWHHDGEGKRLRLLVYLSDVGPSDQQFRYLVGSHKKVHYREYFGNSNFDHQLHGIGAAGTAFLFDTNGIHRGVRTKGSVRDSINFRYEPDTFMAQAKAIGKRILELKRDWL